MKPYGLIESGRYADRWHYMDVGDCVSTGASSKHHKLKSSTRQSVRRLIKKAARRKANVSLREWY